MKRIVVLGGAGLIGSHLSIALARSGNEVIVVDVRDIAESRLLWPHFKRREIRYINHNVTQPFSVECDQIYNLASPSALKMERENGVSILRTNILGSLNSLDLARRNRAQVLFASASDVYGSTPHGISSESERTSVILTPFAEAKRAAEAIHMAYQREYGLDCRIARIFSTYGTGCQAEDQRVVMKMIRSALRGEDIIVYGDGEQCRTFCWVGDVVEALIAMMALKADDRSRMINIGSGHEVTINHLARKIIALTGSSSRIVYLPSRVGDPRRIVPDLTLSRRSLEWTPTTSLSEGLCRTIAYVEELMMAEAKQ